MELSISIEETNKLRKKIGLPLIPTVTNGSSNDVDSTKKSSTSSAGESYKTSLSLEETNKLRASIGLPLIPLEDGIANEEEQQYQNSQRLNESKLKTDKVVTLKMRLDQTKADLAKSKLIANGTLLDRIGTGDETSEDWLEKVGVKKQTASVKPKPKRVTIATQEPDKNDFDNISVGHDVNLFNKMVEKSGDSGVVLTLKDKSIHDDDISEDELENVDLNERLKVQENLKAKQKEKKIDTMDDFTGLANFDSAEGDDQDKITVGSFKLNNGLVEKNANTETISHPNKKKRNVVLFEDDDNPSDVEERSDYLKEKKPKMKKLKKLKTANRRITEKRDEPPEFQRVELLNEDILEEDNADLNEFLSITRRKHQSSKRTTLTQNQEPETDDNSNEMISNDDSRLLVDEDVDFLSNIRAKESDDDTLRTEDSHSQSNVQLISESKVSSLLNDSPSETSYGLAATLKLLGGTTAQKSNKTPIDETGKGKDNYNPKINLVYTDDSGNVLDTKGAYKYLSHKFHGHKK
ncbi:hypothetical protein CANARDRAFT_27615 [[Candida] arabinofermentans NRRL YB-2248]|uniref:Uncharacterized protein n=1 Tax=[Candida] arabinofermentans NRRL YB-2248 TaxID=983967 RepID=A0A1E4T3U5_9ASCO|nr:hypothetical protein CANARDRAFT_27615 [[Candida] arabinofermentans NRRL YB-2248]